MSGRPRDDRAIRRGLPITRERRGESFVYLLRGTPLRSARELARIEALAVPPAWVDVRIAGPRATKVVARGVDAAGRVQTIYHPSFRKKQERKKFERLVRFAAALPSLRAAVDRDMRRHRLGKRRVTACVVHLIDLQFFRVGSTQYAKQRGSYGVTTLRREHVKFTNGTAQFDFPGKSGVRNRRRVHDERVTRLLARLAEQLPGPELFRFLDEANEPHSLRSTHVNAYVRRHMGEEFTAKDFRTWGGTVTAAVALLDQDDEAFANPTSQKRALREAVREAASRLGNTPAVTKSSYVDPRVLQAAEHPDVLRRVRAQSARMRPRRYLDRGEQSTLALLAAMNRSHAKVERRR